VARVRRVKKKARRIATFGLLSIAAIVLVVVTLGSVFFEIVDKYNEKRNLETRLVVLKDEKKELENDVKKLEDPDYLARYARAKYGFSKEGEYVFRITPKEDEE